MTACTECKGTGRIVLFTSNKPCAACGGTGNSPTSYRVTLTDEQRRELLRDWAAGNAAWGVGTVVTIDNTTLTNGGTEP
jgi:DnaJ-class molecular chaperone